MAFHTPGQNFEEIISGFKSALSKLRAGRASIDLVESVQVDAYGIKMPLQQLATFAIPEPRLVIVQPWDKGLLKNIEGALREQLKDFNPVVETGIIRIPFPPPTEERRRELVKEVGRITEEVRAKVRRVREKIIEELEGKKDNKEISEDEFFRKKEEVQKTVDECNEKIEEMRKKKEEEILLI